MIDTHDALLPVREGRKILAKNIVRRESLSKQVSDRLEEMIASGEYEIGAKIPAEPELADMFQVSRNTIREAIQSLTWAGLLSVKQGDGTYVCSSDRFHANMEQKYQEVSLSDIKEARNCIEVTIVHLAARRRCPQDIEAIQTMLAKRKTLETDSKENTEADLNFHIAIARACHNKILIDMYESISGYMRSQIEEQNRTSAFSSAEIDKLHEDLFLAIQAGNPEQAAAAAMQILNI